MKNPFKSPLSQYLKWCLKSYPGNESTDRLKLLTPALSNQEFEDLIEAAKGYDRMRALQHAAVLACPMELEQAARRPRDPEVHRNLENAMNVAIARLEKEDFPVRPQLQTLIRVVRHTGMTMSQVTRYFGWANDIIGEVIVAGFDVVQLVVEPANAEAQDDLDELLLVARKPGQSRAA